MTLTLIGGEFKGRRLKTPKGAQTRPTTAIVRKAVFDICQNITDGARFLDIFAGTGAMGLEALSRGAAHVSFVENDREAIKCLQENIATLNVKSKTALHTGDALAFLRRLKETYDIIYIDPPYGKYRIADILDLLDKAQILTPEGSLFIEEKEKLEEMKLTNLKLKSSRRFGITYLYQFTT